MKENKGRFPWLDWAKFETIDCSGRAIQWEDKPFYEVGYWWLNGNGRYLRVGDSAPIPIGMQVITERYPSESETAPAETDAPDLQARVEALEVEVKRLRDLATPEISLCYDVSPSDMTFRFFGTVNGEVAPKPDPAAPPVAKSATESVISGEEMHKAFCKVCDDVFGSEPDPTAQKVEALKLLFPWRDGCEFMTVDGRDGHVWQWTAEPVKGESNCWTALGSDPQARRVGEINLDPGLSKILIKRNDGE